MIKKGFILLFFCLSFPAESTNAAEGFECNYVNELFAAHKEPNRREKEFHYESAMGILNCSDERVKIKWAPMVILNYVRWRFTEGQAVLARSILDRASGDDEVCFGLIGSLQNLRRDIMYSTSRQAILAQSNKRYVSPFGLLVGTGINDPKTDDEKVLIQMTVDCISEIIFKNQRIPLNTIERCDLLEAKHKMEISGNADRSEEVDAELRRRRHGAK